MVDRSTGVRVLTSSYLDYFPIAAYIWIYLEDDFGYLRFGPRSWIFPSRMLTDANIRLVCVCLWITAVPRRCCCHLRPSRCCEELRRGCFICDHCFCPLFPSEDFYGTGVVAISRHWILDLHAVPSSSSCYSGESYLTR